jgi:hypothetical protein
MPTNYYFQYKSDNESYDVYKHSREFNIKRIINDEGN